MRLLLLAAIASSFLVHVARSDPQVPFQRSTTAAEDRLYEATEQWLQANSLATSCSSCISLLQVTKNLAYMSEGMFIAALTNACRRTKKVDAEVVS